MEKDKMSTQLKFRVGAEANSISRWVKPKAGAPSLSNPLIIMTAHRVQL